MAFYPGQQGYGAAQHQAGGYPPAVILSSTSRIIPTARLLSQGGGGYGGGGYGGPPPGNYGPPPQQYNMPPPAPQGGGPYGYNNPPPNPGGFQQPNGYPGEWFPGSSSVYGMLTIGRPTTSIRAPEQPILTRKPPSASATSNSTTAIRSRRSGWLCISIFQLHRSEESTFNWHQLFRTTWTIKGLHQRCQEYVNISESKLWVCARRHGHIDG